MIAEKRGDMRTAGLFLLALIVPVSALHAADDYVIRLNRPMRVGDRYRIDAKGAKREQQRITISGQVQNESKVLSVHLIAVGRVLAVDSRRRASRTEYLIETLQRTSLGTTEDVLSAGRKVVAESKGGKTMFTVDGGPASAPVSDALSVVISASAPDSPTDDEIFGTRERKRVGESWSIDSASAAAYLSKAGLSVSPKDLEGKVSLDDVTTVGAVKALEITAHLRAERMKVSLPDWAKIEEASMEAGFTGLVPVDPDIPNLLPDTILMNVSMLVRGERPEDRAAVTMEMSMETSLEKSYPPLSDKGMASPPRP